jgi:CBS domain-containing protein
VEEVLGYFGGDTSSGRRGFARYIEQGLVTDLENPLELGKGHGIIGERDFVDAVRARYLSPAIKVRELPAAGKIKGRVEPERLVSAVCTVLRVGRDDLLKKGYRGYGRGLLMEMLYRYGGMNQPEIGAMLGIDYSTVSVGRKRFLMKMETDSEIASLFAKAKSRISQG